MKLNERTLTVLKNFAGINPGIVFLEGKKQKTMNAEQTILAEVTLDEDFTESFGIYDLNQFLGNITTLNDPELTLSAEKVTLNDGEIELNYYTCLPNLLVSPPKDRELVIDNPDVTFNLSQNSLNKILKIGSMNDLPDISILGNKKGLFVRTHELKNDTSNYADMRIDDYTGDNFSATFKMEYIKLIPDNYTVMIKLGGFSCWTNADNTLKYFIAIEKKDKK